MKHFQNSAVAMENSKSFVCIHLFKSPEDRKNSLFSSYE